MRAGLLLALGLAGLAQAPAWAANPAECLVRPAEALAPAGAFGQVRVRMSFSQPDAPPSVQVQQSSAPEPVRDAVLAYVARYRLPCLEERRHAHITQEFDFGAERPAPAPTPTDDTLLRCLSKPQDGLSLPTPSQRADYGRSPRAANVIADLRFESAEGPPLVAMVYNSMPEAAQDAVSAHLQAFRLPCLPAGRRVTLRQSLRSPWGPPPESQPRRYSWPQFLAAFKLDMPALDPVALACPAQLRWTLGRPAVANEVTELGLPDARRRPWLDWLRQATPALAPEVFEARLGSTSLIDVPCEALR